MFILLTERIIFNTTSLAFIFATLLLVATLKDENQEFTFAWFFSEGIFLYLVFLLLTIFDLAIHKVKNNIEKNLLLVLKRTFFFVYSLYFVFRGMILFISIVFGN